MRPYASLLASVILLALATAGLKAQATLAGPYRGSPWLLSAAPSFELPLVAGDGGSEPPLSSAWGASLSARRQVSRALSLRASGAWSSAAISAVSGVTVDGSLSEFSLLGGAGIGRSLSDRLSAELFLDGGACLGSLNGGSGVLYPAARAGAGLELSLPSGLGARLEASCEYKAGLYSGLALGLALAWNPPESKGAKDQGLRLLELRTAELGAIFPVLRSYYEEHPFGRLVLTNNSRKALRDIKVSFRVTSYMDSPKELAAVAILEPGASVEVPVTALFNEEILKVTEPTRVAAEFGLTVGSDAAAPKAATVLIQDRTALTWDDDRKAAAFVSSKDPWVLDLVGNVNAAIRDSRNAEVPQNLQSAMAVHEGLRIYGLGYLKSPSRPFAQAQVDGAAVDNLKFPRQTLAYRSGDCADLSVLYASCLEAMGIETAFVTVPGHIFMAAELGLSPIEAKARGIEPERLIVRDGRAWVPVETTIRDKGFSEVWLAAAKEWQEASAKGTAAFYPVREAWKRYAPVGLLADGSMILPLSREAMLSSFRAELGTLVGAQLSARIAALSPLPDKGASGKALNERGILYGRYGLLAEAERYFQAAAKASYAPAVVNLGNVAFLKGDADAAYRCFKQALAASPENPKILANLIKAEAALGKTEELGRSLAALKAVDPQAAARASGLAPSGADGLRAAEVGEESVAWL